jgi:hypothetical protein
VRPQDRRYDQGERERSDEHAPVISHEDEKCKHDRAGEIDRCLRGPVAEAKRAFEGIERIAVRADEPS